ncbi:MAG: NAD-dependent epimerase/dehydratase family protein [Bacteroidetes bacterium]|nr:NAD-dependent epimerase/dehydratase family protein [Bacteroidota bacterium]
MEKVLVTGGAGNVGGALAELLVKNGYYVIIVDNLLTGSLDKLPPKSYSNWKFYHVDVNDHESFSKVMKSEAVDYVFHYAALVGVDRTLSNPVMVMEDLKGIRNVCELCVDLKVKRVFFSSSSEVYGEPVEFPQHEETTPLNARLPYAQVKAIGESFFESYHKTYGLEYTIFRFFNTYGPKQSSDFVISRFVRAALKGEDLTIIGDGVQTRTFCLIDDNLNFTLRCLREGLFLNDTINLGNDNEISIKDLAYIVKETLHSPSKLMHLPAREDGDMKRRLPCLNKMRLFMKDELIDLPTGIRAVAEGLVERGEIPEDDITAQFGVFA